MLHIHGYSGTIVCIGGDVEDEVSPGHSIVIGTPTQGMRVKMTYSPKPVRNACWRGSVEQLGEDVPMFPCEVSVADNGYSVLFTVHCPIGTPVTVGKRILNVKVAP